MKSSQQGKLKWICYYSQPAGNNNYHQPATVNFYHRPANPDYHCSYQPATATYNCCYQQATSTYHFYNQSALRSPWWNGNGVRLATGRSRVRSPLWERSFDLPYRHQVLVLGPGNGLESISNK
ncbi:hypothetical protein DPMN_142666 [Dreissena polymorpha]|uniref:Uncharacterized protein n=1 Tax=Dreissena polymorpha TaxID=45954 RepID=A0A9D4JME4_DREPO|nr:hypothetical protein DPMN_142666 [Dreissena polymorpha]